MTAVCPYGAVPIPGHEGTQLWLGAGDLPADVKTWLNTNAPWVIPSLAPFYITVPELCARSMEEPTAFDANDLSIGSLGAKLSTFLPAVPLGEKAWEWTIYNAYKTHCACAPYSSTDPALNCVPPQSFTVPPVAAPHPLGVITLDGAPGEFQLLGGTSSWTLFVSGSATWSGGAPGTSFGAVEFQATDGSWVPFYSLRSAVTRPNEVIAQAYNVSTPKFGSSFAVRYKQSDNPIGTISNLTVCLTKVPPSPPGPLPPQPNDIFAPPPPIVCDNATLCEQVSELGRRMTVLATQLSDVQAFLMSTDQLQVLATHPISGEGELTIALGTRVVSVELLALGPEVYTSALGRPRGLMRAGSVRYGDGVGYSPRRFIDADKFDDIRPAGALSVSYQLLEGTSGNLKFLG